MTKARNLSDLLDTNGDVKSSALDNVPDSTNASALSSGTVAPARLGSGTASSTTFLAGDSSYKTITGTTINNNADNRIITGSGTANTLEGEAKLTFDGSILNNVQSAGAASEIKASAATVYTKVIADDASGFSAIDYSHDLRFKDAGTEKWRIDSSGNILPSSTSQGIYLGVTSATASNLLHDYEEGTFTPSISPVGATLNAVNSYYANYTKIGALVHVNFGAVLVTSSGTPSRYDIGNMPFQSNTNAVGSGFEYGHTGQMQMCNIDPNSTTVYMRKYDGSQIASAYLKMSITYTTDA